MVRTMAQFNALTPEQAAAGLPVQKQGTVICCDEAWNQLFVHDGSSTEYWEHKLFTNKFRRGEFIEITGKTCLSGGRPSLTNAAARVLGSRPIPAPRRIGLRDLEKHRGEWVEVTGRVRVAETSRGRLSLLLHDGGKRAVVHVLGDSLSQDFRRLLGCRIKVSAISDQVRYEGLLSAPTMFGPCLKTITLLDSPAFDPMPAKVVSIEQLLERPIGPWTNEPVHVTGIVTAHEPGNSIVLRGVGTSAIKAAIIQQTPGLQSQRVGIWGYLELTANGPVLMDAYAEPVGGNSAPLAYYTPTQDIAPADTEALTNISAMLKLPREETARKLPVKFKGVITYSDPDYLNHFLQDGMDAVYLECPQRDLRSGDAVEVTGVTDPGGFNPQVIGAQVRVLGSADLPRAIKVEMDDLGGGQMDCRWVEMEGIVRRASLENQHLKLKIVTRKGRFYVNMPGISDTTAADSLIDALVRVTGACSSMLNREGQLTGITLNVPGMRHIQRLDTALEDPFSVPATSITSVSRFDPNRLVGHRVKIQGAITFASGEGMVYVQDDSGGMRVSLMDTNRLRAGDVVEVLGFPALAEPAPYLEEASARKTGAVQAVVPKNVTAEEILHGAWVEGELVRMEAQLVQDVPQAARPRLVLQDDAAIFTAVMSSYADAARVAGLRSGTMLRVTGVCSVQAGEGQRPEAFRLLVAGAEGIEILREPSWLTSRRLFATAAILAMAVLAAMAWIHLLRRQVRAQTEVIREKLRESAETAEKLAAEKQLLATLIDHMPDHVFARDPQGKFLLANSTYVGFHGLGPMERMPGRSMYDCFPEPVARERLERDAVLLRGEEELLQEEMLLADSTGAKHWIHTIRVPLMDQQGKITGLVGISRNVTGRKRAEAEMERMHQQLLEVSRNAGMAEVATSVLHNVGNVLNSVNVSASIISDQVRSSRAGKIADVSKLLKENAANPGHFFTEDPRGRQLPGYIESLAAHLETERAAMLKELDSLGKNVEHIKDIVAMQQSYAVVRGVVDTVPVADLIEDALRLNAAAIERHGVVLKRNYDPARLPTITVEKHKVLQILINLIRNAKYACDESGRTDKVLTLSAANGDGRVRISVRDNGVGIRPEHLNRIFNHGFTTRKTGHGFGLHSGALAAKELAGSLTVHSDGPGCGAIFTLELPADRKPA